MSEESNPACPKSPLPSEKMPGCWAQEERMNALFSPFRSKSVNPQDWASKYKFWKSLIYEWLSHRMQCSFSIVDLNEAFKRKGCTPLCLKTVVEELLRNNEIIQETDFWREPSDTWTAWSIDIFVKKPLTWSYYKIKNYVISAEPDVESRYIYLQILKELGDTVLSILENKKRSTLVPFSDIVNYCISHTNKNISEDTILLAVMWLRRIKKIACKESSSEHGLLIKLIAQPMDNITEVEEGLFNLWKQESELAKEICVLEEEKINVINQTKSYLAKGLRQVAKTHLRRKVELERKIEKRAQTLDNLSALILSIQESHTNTAVLSAFKTGSDVLKKLTEDGLSDSNVRDIMDDLSDTLEDHKEVQLIMSESLKISDTDVDLEAELAELLKPDEPALSAVSDSKLNDSIVELEHNLSNLSIKDSAVGDKSSPRTVPESNRRKKALLDLGCS